MFSPLFPDIAQDVAKELRVVEIVPEGHQPLPEPFNRLSLRRKPDDIPHPYEIARHYTGQGAQSVLPPVAGKRMKIVPTTVETNRTVASIEEAELAVLNLTYTTSNIMRFDGKGNGSCVGDINVAFTIMINRTANLIAARTRRGAGNLVFMHPDSLKIITESSINAFKAASEEETIGLWSKAGAINGSIVIYTNPDFTKDRAVVVYQGNIGDGPAQLVNREDKTYIAIHESAVDYVGTVLIDK